MFGAVKIQVDLTAQDSHAMFTQAKAGDLLFWGSPGGTYHVAIALGGGQYIHAPQPGESVKVGSVQWFAPDFAVSM